MNMYLSRIVQKSEINEIYQLRWIKTTCLLTVEFDTFIHCKQDGGEVKCKSGVYSCFNTFVSVSHILNLPSLLILE